MSTGPNKSIAPQELEQSLGEERIQWLVEQTGMPREQLLAGFCGELPDAIDKLTPNGRVPQMRNCRATRSSQNKSRLIRR